MQIEVFPKKKRQIVIIGDFGNQSGDIIFGIVENLLIRHIGKKCRNLFTDAIMLTDKKCINGS